MNELLNFTICSGLKLPIDQEQTPKVLDTIPDSCFGVFVTARRTHEYYEQYKRKIKTHGEEGYWNIDYSELPKEKILFKQADMFELLFFCVRQRRLGNANMNIVFSNGVEFLANQDLNERGSKLLGKLMKEYGGI